MPGDAAELLLSNQPESVSEEKITELRKELGLDAPLPVRYLRWFGRAVVLDLGTSFRTGEPVSREILHRLPTTLTLAGAAFIFTVSLSMAGGIVSALFQNRLPDRCHRIWTIFTISIPDYWMGLMLILIFSLKLHWLSVAGGNGFTTFILPVLTLGLSISAADGRIFRASILEILTQNLCTVRLCQGPEPDKGVSSPCLQGRSPAHALHLGHAAGPSAGRSRDC